MGNKTAEERRNYGWACLSYLCPTLQLLKNNNFATNFKCVYTGNVTRSTDSHYLVNFKKGGKFDRQGGCVISTEL